MKRNTVLPKTNEDVLASIVSLATEMTYTKEKLEDCEKAIADNSKQVSSLQFCVDGMKEEMSQMRKSFVGMKETTATFVTYLKLCSKLLKMVSGVVTVLTLIELLRPWIN